MALRAVSRCAVSMGAGAPVSRQTRPSGLRRGVACLPRSHQPDAAAYEDQRAAKEAAPRNPAADDIALPLDDIGDTHQQESKAQKGEGGTGGKMAGLPLRQEGIVLGGGSSGKARLPAPPMIRIVRRELLLEGILPPYQAPGINT